MCMDTFLQIYLESLRYLAHESNDVDICEETTPSNIAHFSFEQPSAIISNIIRRVRSLCHATAESGTLLLYALRYKVSVAVVYRQPVDPTRRRRRKCRPLFPSTRPDEVVLHGNTARITGWKARSLEHCVASLANNRRIIKREGKKIEEGGEDGRRSSGKQTNSEGAFNNCKVIFKRPYAVVPRSGECLNFGG
ncbi:hypothetical protein ANTQUA_LOCUS8866 [Anthophora quadrimaculata]